MCGRTDRQTDRHDHPVMCYFHMLRTRKHLKCFSCFKVAFQGSKTLVYIHIYIYTHTHTYVCIYVCYFTPLILFIYYLFTYLFNVLHVYFTYMARNCLQFHTLWKYLGCNSVNIKTC